MPMMIQIDCRGRVRECEIEKGGLKQGEQGSIHEGRVWH